MMQEIAKISTLTSLSDANNNDLIPIVDIDGGYNGRPKTKNITVANLLKDLVSQIENYETSLSINANNYAQKSIALGNVYALTKMLSSVSNLRVRLYMSQAQADNDITRAIAGALPVSHGLIYDAVLPTGVLSLDILPCAFAAPLNNTIMVVNNLTAAAVNPTITFNLLRI